MQYRVHREEFRVERLEFNVPLPREGLGVGSVPLPGEGLGVGPVFRFLVLLLLFSLSAGAQENANSRQARQMFDRAYEKVFGPQGSSLSYKVNIIGIYKTEGTIWMKGKQSKFVDSKLIAWNDGVTAYVVDKRKRQVEIHSSKSEKYDKHSKKFTFNPDDFNYHVDKEKSGYKLTLKAKPGKKGIKEAYAWLSNNYEPQRLRIKVAFFWTTVQINNFHSGNIDERILLFPRQQYAGWKTVDRRRE